jgi:hypothetical protein
VSDEYRWPAAGPTDIRDGLTTADVIDALYAPALLRMDNRVPVKAPTFMAVCAPTRQHWLIVVVCVRSEPDEDWTIVGARDARPDERLMWRKYTS